MHAGKCSLISGTSSPFHDNEQALFPMVHVFVEVQDAHYVRPVGGAPVQLHLAACFRAVVENLPNTERRRKTMRSGGKTRCTNATGWKSFANAPRRACRLGMSGRGTESTRTL